MQQADLKSAAARALARLRATRDATGAGQTTQALATTGATNGPNLFHGEVRKRPIIEYRFAADPPDRWHTMLGRPGDSLEEASTSCKRQFGDVVETRPRVELPAGFPFRRKSDAEGEWKSPPGSV